MMPRFDPYQELRRLMAPEYKNLSPWEVDTLFESYNLSAENLEGFFSTLSDFGKAVLGAAPEIGLVGGAILGGPGGAATGAAIGKAAAGGIKQITVRPSQTRPKPTVTSVQGATPTAGPDNKAAAQTSSTPQALPGASPAASQLLSVLFSREALDGLKKLLLGQLAGSEVKVGDKSVPVMAVAQLIETLAQKIQTEHQASNPGTQEGIPDYLLDSAGELVIDDPYEPENRADFLLSLLRQVYLKRLDSLRRMTPYPPMYELEELDFAEWEFPEDIAWEEVVEDFYPAFEFVEYYDDETMW